MTQWYVKELSRLTKVSVRTLHHYDKIGLLKPSIRLENNYRVYSETDLLKLQQILALKFFGFELRHIKTLMKEEINIFDHFQAQKTFLEKKIESLQEAIQTLDVILSERAHNRSVSWKTIMKLIEDYQMTKEIEYEWVKKSLNPTELKEYASFEKALKTRFTPEAEEASGQQWNELVKDVEANLDKDPTSDFGVQMGKRCMDWVNAVFPTEHAALRKSLWEKGFKGGYTDVSTDVVAWLDKAHEEYYTRRFLAVLSQAETHPTDALVSQWEELVSEVCGDSQELKEELYQKVFAHDKISPAAKAWVKKHFR